MAVGENFFEYFSSPILNKNKFKHAFFTKSCPEKYLLCNSNTFSENFVNCNLKQIHSNNIVFGSSTQTKKIIEADGLICDKFNQNLWIYTADCMPILFADKSKRTVAAVHCGRKGLEKNIINNLIKNFDKKGSSREDLLVAIGPSISKKHYLVDKKTAKEFYKNIENKSSIFILHEAKQIFNFIFYQKKQLIQLDLKKYAYRQLINENIPSKNIEISSLCTYENENDFFSWRKTKTSSRQWSFICSQSGN